MFEPKPLEISNLDQALSNVVFNSTIRPLQQKLSTRPTKLKVELDESGHIKPFSETSQQPTKSRPITTWNQQQATFPPPTNPHTPIYLPLYLVPFDLSHSLSSSSSLACSKFGTGMTVNERIDGNGNISVSNSTEATECVE